MITSYFNGNYFVIIRDDGTKIYRSLRSNVSKLEPNFPDSLDLKITNKCSFECPYCHENSVMSGKSFNLERTIKVLSDLPKVGIEVAVGGGDVMEEMSDTISLLKWIKSNMMRGRVTINIKDVEKFGIDKIKELRSYSDYLGVSINRDTKIDEVIRIINILYNEVILHVIVGVNTVEQIKSILELNNKYNKYNKLLVLGYKTWGRGKNFSIPNIEDWSSEFKRLLLTNNFNGIIGFDNLAIEQLGIRDSMLESDWNTSYMGDEFTHSMYIDAVNETFSPTSRDPLRVSWNNMSLLDFFKKYKKDDIVR